MRHLNDRRGLEIVINLDPEPKISAKEVKDLLR